MSPPSKGSCWLIPNEAWLHGSSCQVLELFSVLADYAKAIMRCGYVLSGRVSWIWYNFNLVLSTGMELEMQWHCGVGMELGRHLLILISYQSPCSHDHKVKEVRVLSMYQACAW